MASQRSMKSHQPQVSKNVSWVTPKWILEPLGEFDLDPCTPEVGMPWTTAKRQVTPRENGLSVKWVGRIWLNPPFNEKCRAEFLHDMALHGNGIALVAASTETDWFRTWIWPYATSILFLARRPHFHYPDGERAKANSGCSICLVGYGSANDDALKNSGLGQYLPIPRPERDACPK